MGPCPECGGVLMTRDGYCSHCGVRRRIPKKGWEKPAALVLLVLGVLALAATAFQAHPLWAAGGAVCVLSGGALYVDAETGAG